MAGSIRSSARLKAALRGPMAAAVACTLAACSSGSSTSSRTTLIDPQAAQDPPGDPQEALLNGEVPLSNPEAPPVNSEQPPPNPEQPSSQGGGTVSSVVDDCNDFCVGVGQNCGSTCARLCGQVSSLVAQCLDAASRYVSCISRLPITCGRNGRLQADNLGDCEDAARAITACAGLGDNASNSTVSTSPPGNGNGPGN